jgi:hypothetical protein
MDLNNAAVNVLMGIFFLTRTYPDSAYHDFCLHLKIRQQLIFLASAVDDSFELERGERAQNGLELLSCSQEY